METDEPLETGHGPATPPGDNFVNDFAQGLAEAYLSLARARADRIQADDDLVLVDGGSASEFGNVAAARRPLSDGEWRPAADRMHAFFAPQPGGSYLVFSAWPTPDLSTLGFGRIGHPPLMLRLPGPVGARPIEGFEIRAVTDAAGAEAWERSFVDGFPEPMLQPFRPRSFLPAEAVNAEGWRYWVGYLHGQPVATASAHVSRPHLHVEYITTLEAARGKGIGRAMTAHATRSEPDRPAMLIASDLGRPVYERLGYRALTRFTLWAGHRPTPPG